MTPDRWARVKEVLANALEKPGRERGAYLNEACGDDEGLRREVESLLAKEQGSWLASPLETAKTPELAPGQMLGRYRVEIKLGQGGMGAVYKAHDSVLRRPVALKVLPPGQLSDPEGRERLTREARAASALNHPNIITVHDISSENGVDFIAMELVEGQPLSDLIPAGGMPVTQALHYAMQVARGLVKAHRAGIIHRDLKPGNIMVTNDGLVKLLDFGLARRARMAAASATTGSLTAEGVISGTPSYMSPEQAQGKPVDARSDIFSFGTVLYEMVSGRKAFHCDSQISTLTAVIHEEPPPLSGSIPPDLAKAITRCIRKDPERRFQHMDDVRMALEDLVEEAEPEARRARRWLWLLLAGALVAVVLILLRMDVFRPSRVISAPIPLTTLPGQEEFPSFSPDGTQVAFARKAGESAWDIFVQVIGSGAPYQRTTDPAHDMFPAWSPDGRSIAFLRNWRQIILVPPIGGTEKVLVETAPLVDAEYPRPGWTPDSKWLAYSEPVSPGKPPALVLMSMVTGEKRRVTTPPPGSGDEAPAFSPDGRTMAFARGSTSGRYDIHLLDLSKSLMPKGEPRKLSSPDQVSHLPAWTADGRELVYSASRGARQIPPSMVLRRIKVGGFLPGLWRWSRKAEIVPLTGTDTEAPAISFARHRLAYGQNSAETSIWRVNVSDSPQPDRSERLIDSTRDESSPQFSPDGRRIAFVSNRSGTAEVWVCDQDGSNPQQLTSLGAVVTGFPRWSPDGQQIAFDSNPEGTEQIYVIPARGGFPRRLTNEKLAAFGASWSKDGRWIYYSLVGDGAWKIPPEGGSPVEVVKMRASHPMESHDGKFLYYGRDSGVWRILVGGGEETKVVQGVWMGMFFTLTEKRIYFIPPPAKAGRNSLRFFDFAAGKSRLVAAIDSRLWIGLTTSPDGRTVLFSKQDKYVSDLMLVENFQ